MNEKIILEDECVDDLQIGGLRILQKKNGFKFGVDAVLLANFAKQVSSKKTLDLCTGTGIVALLLSAKTKTPIIKAIEIQHEIADMASRSVQMNHLENRIEITELDLKQAPSFFGKGIFDKITCNPPYMETGTGDVNEVSSKSIARHEILCTLEDVIKTSSMLLKPQGRLFMVHRPTRLADIMCFMRKYKIEPKRLQMVHAAYHKAAKLILIEGIYCGKKELKLLEPLYLYNEDGSYTKELLHIYERQE